MRAFVLIILTLAVLDLGLFMLAQRPPSLIGMGFILMGMLLVRKLLAHPDRRA